MNWGQLIAGLALLVMAWLTTKAWHDQARAEARNLELEAEIEELAARIAHERGAWTLRRRLDELKPEARR